MNKTLKDFFVPPYEYLGTVLKIVDGDTVDILIDEGFGNSIEQRVRLARIDAPEMKYGGSIAKNRVIELLPINTVVKVKTFKNREDRYGRYIAEIFFVLGGEFVNLSNVLLIENLVKEYKQ